MRTNIFLGLLLILVTVVAEVIIILIFVLIELVLIEVLKLLERQSLTGEPIDGAGNQLLLDVLTQLVVEFQTLLDVGCGVVIFLRWGDRRGEEVEK